MPIIVLGLIVALIALAYSIIRYINDDRDDKKFTRETIMDAKDKVEERVAEVFQQDRKHTFKEDPAGQAEYDKTPFESDQELNQKKK